MDITDDVRRPAGKGRALPRFSEESWSPSLRRGGAWRRWPLLEATRSGKAPESECVPVSLTTGLSDLPNQQQLHASMQFLQACGSMPALIEWVVGLPFDCDARLPFVLTTTTIASPALMQRGVPADWLSVLFSGGETAWR